VQPLLGDYILNKMTDLPRLLQKLRLHLDQSARLGEDSLVILASFSGNTEDTAAALRFANEKGATTISFTSKSDSILAREADEAIVYNSNALFILPLAGAFIFALEIARLQGRDVSKLFEQLQAMPRILGKIYKEEEKRVARLAIKYRDYDLFYVLSSASAYAIGYKFGSRSSGKHESERIVHGDLRVQTRSAEMFDGHKPLLVFLVGTDESRDMSERVIKIAQSNGSEVIRFDAKDYEFRSALRPIPLDGSASVVRRLFGYYRGIFDLDERVLMEEEDVHRKSDYLAMIR
jgi:fructoselysine-6-P-deglycase FrlB-like protein